jgi:hypothetical protein
MYHSEEIIRQLQSQKILAMKLDRAVRDVGEEVKGQLSNIGAGAQRPLYYTSCFTDEDYSPADLSAIQHALMRANVYISTSTLTSYSFSAGVASTVCLYVTLPPSGLKIVSGLTGAAIGGLGLYGVVQKAADSAHRLQVMHPAYYQALYLRELEMMYFLVEPAFARAGVLTQQWTDGQSPYGVADTILKLMGRH